METKYEKINHFKKNCVFGKSFLKKIQEEKKSGEISSKKLFVLKHIFHSI